MRKLHPSIKLQVQKGLCTADQSCTPFAQYLQVFILSQKQQCFSARLSVCKHTHILRLWYCCVTMSMHTCRLYGRVARAKWAYPEDQLGALPETPVEECLQQLDAHVGQLCDALKPDSMLFVCVGPGDTTHQRRKEVTAALGLLVCLLTVLCIGAARPGFLACIVISLDHVYKSFPKLQRGGVRGYGPCPPCCAVMSIHLTVT